MSLYFEVILLLAGCRFQVGLINNQVLSLDLDMKCTYSQYLINGHVWIIVFSFLVLVFIYQRNGDRAGQSQSCLHTQTKV